MALPGLRIFGLWAVVLVLVIDVIEQSGSSDILRLDFFLLLLLLIDFVGLLLL